jgi:hypothetical protein
MLVLAKLKNAQHIAKKCAAGHSNICTDSNAIENVLYMRSMRICMIMIMMDAYDELILIYIEEFENKASASASLYIYN